MLRAAALLAVLAGCGAEPAAEADAPDACKSWDEAEPLVVLGQGRSAYAPLEDHTVVPLEAGAQGGHHVWLAVRTRGLTERGSLLTLRGHFPELDAAPPRFERGVSLHAVDDGYCELHGIRFQLDGDLDVDAIRGQSLDIDLSITDAAGDVATANKTVTVAAEPLRPAG